MKKTACFKRLFLISNISFYMEFASRLEIPPSATLAMNTLAAKKRAAGETVYNMTVGEPQLSTPQPIVQAAIQALEDGKNGYTPTRGIDALRAAAVSWMNRAFQSAYSQEETFITCGGKYALYALFQTLLNPQDEVLLVTPYWVSYSAQVQLAGGVPRFINTTEEAAWKVTPQQIVQFASEKTKVLVLNNAGNPTGALYTKTELAAILEAAKSCDMLVISDEVYSGLIYDDAVFISAAEFPQHKDRVVIVQSCSKNFAMTGWRVGVIFAPEELVGKLATLQGQSTSNTSSISQWAAVTAFDQAETLTAEIRTQMQERRDAFTRALQEFFGIEVKPSAGLYGFVSLASLQVVEKDDTAWCMQALEKGNIATVPGSAFGMPGYVRLSFGMKPQQIAEALRALKQYIGL